MKIKFYTLDNIKAQDADYNLIYGERSNGKTTAVLGEGIKNFLESGEIEQLALVRRWEEDFKGEKGKKMFEGIEHIGWIKEWSNCKYDSVYYYSQKWYLCRYNEKGEREEVSKLPFCHGFALTMEEHYKSTSYPNVRTILFDEFITRGYYLPDEFIKFQNLLSTIIRLRDDVKIYMCGNTINKYCPYFNEMGLTNIKKQDRGTIDIYTYGESSLRVAVEYSDFPSKKKPSNKYFAFNNPKLNMITHGGWEIDIYPHLPSHIKLTPKDILYKFYIVFDGDIIQGNIVELNDNYIIYIHRKTTPIRDDNEQLIYQCSVDYRPNYKTTIFRPSNRLEALIADIVNNKKVFYQDNELGEIFSNYLKWCETA